MGKIDFYSTMCAFLVPFKSYYLSGKKTKLLDPANVHNTGEVQEQNEFSNREGPS